MTQLEALETARLEVAAATQEEINAGILERRELQRQLAEARQLIQQQGHQLQALKSKAQNPPKEHGPSSMPWRGIITAAAAWLPNIFLRPKSCSLYIDYARPTTADKAGTQECWTSCAGLQELGAQVMRILRMRGADRERDTTSWNQLLPSA